ncbi:MAG: HD domain-containing protein [Fibrobacteria bacterium]|nr:HD domain-containing protein [Fibrobacteria bacterium]
MEKTDLIIISSWFEDYADSFLTGEEEFDQVLKLKKDHSWRVYEETLALGQSLNLPENELLLAGTAALLHDIGRFEQYLIYGTFVDGKSENHARLGLKILHKKQILHNLQADERLVIMKAIANHNRMQISKGLKGIVVRIAQMLRDADKLDILNLVTEYYNDKNAASNKAIELDMPDLPEINRDILSAVIDNKLARVNDMRSLNDFKLIQMAWVYDMNFSHSLYEVKNRGYLKKIYRTLPDMPESIQAFEAVNAYLTAKID